MATDTFQIEQPTQPREKGSGCLKGCLIAAGIGLVLALLLAWYIYSNLRTWGSEFATMATDQMIEGSGLPEQEKAELKAEVKRLTDGFSDGSISFEQMQAVFLGLIESPLGSMFMVQAIEKQYLDVSGLTDEEKAAAKVTLQRYARGLASKKISLDSTDRVLVHVADKDAEGQWQIREQVTDEELKAFLEAAKTEADEAEVPEEVEPIDPSDELKKVIDEVLGPAQAE